MCFQFIRKSAFLQLSKLSNTCTNFCSLLVAWASAFCRPSLYAYIFAVFALVFKITLYSNLFCLHIIHWFCHFCKLKVYAWVFASLYAPVMPSVCVLLDTLQMSLWFLPVLLISLYACIFAFCLCPHFMFFLWGNEMNDIMRKLVLAICKQQRCRSACASAQSDQHLYCLLLRQYNTSSFYIQIFKTLACLCSWAGQFESYLVTNPEERFPRDEAQMYFGGVYKNSFFCYHFHT